jgi:RNA polymerase primary sigma factor
MSDHALTKFFLPSRRSAGLASEPGLLVRVIAGDGAAAGEFLRLAIPPISAAIAKIETSEAERQAALLYVLEKLKEGGYRRLQAFNGRARLASFLILVAREVLAQRAAERLFADPNTGWVGFTRIFDRDIQARIAKRFPHDSGNMRWEDLYQDICEKLVESDCRRLRSYSGEGSFIGFVLTIVDRLLIDMMRQEAPRRRLPAAIKRMPQLEQEIYMAIAWKGCAADVARLSEVLASRIDMVAVPDSIREALARVLDVAAPLKRDAPNRVKTVSLDAIIDSVEEYLSDPSSMTPEEELLLVEEERTREAIIALIRASAETLADDERLYLQTVFSTSETMPRRKIAEILGCSVEEVDRLRQRTQRWFATLRQKFQNNGGSK